MSVSYLLQEDGVSRIILEDGSGLLLLDTGAIAPNVTLMGQICMSIPTWIFLFLLLGLSNDIL